MRYKFEAIPCPFEYPGSMGSLIGYGYDMHVHCNNVQCLRHREVNLVDMARRFGPNTRLMAPELKRILYCSECRKAGRPDRNLQFSIAGGQDKTGLKIHEVNGKWIPLYKDGKFHDERIW